MRTATLSLHLAIGLALLAPAARAQAPAWTTAVQAINPTPTNDSQARVRSIDSDVNGNVYVSGRLYPSQTPAGPGVRNFGSAAISTGSNNIIGYAARLNAAGQWQWATELVATGANSSGSQTVFVESSAVTAGGDLYVVGSVDGTNLRVGTLTQPVPGGVGNFVTKLNSNGQAQWITVFGSDNSFASLGVNRSTGEAVVAGGYENGSLTIGTTTLPAPAAGTTNGYLARLSAAGQWTMAQSLAATANGDTEFFAPVVGPQGQVAVGVLVQDGSVTLGSNTLTAAVGSETNALAQLGTNNQWQWTARTAGSNADLSLRDWQYDGTGNLWVHGDAAGGAPFGTRTLPADAKTFVGRVSASGQWDQLGAITTASNGFSSGETLTVDGSGNAVVTGTLEGGSGTANAYTFGSQTLSVTGRTRDYVARYSAAGQWDYALLAPALNNPAVGDSYAFRAVCLAPTGTLFAAADFFENSALTFGSSTVTAGANRDIFVAQLSNAGTPLGVRRRAAAPALTLWPNPATGGSAATLRLAAPATTALPLVLRDALGRAVRQASVSAGQQQAAVPTAGLAPGVYLLEAGASRAQLVVE